MVTYEEDFGHSCFDEKWYISVLILHRDSQYLRNKILLFCVLCYIRKVVCWGMKLTIVLWGFLDVIPRHHFEYIFSSFIFFLMLWINYVFTDSCVTECFSFYFHYIGVYKLCVLLVDTTSFSLYKKILGHKIAL